MIGRRSGRVIWFVIYTYLIANSLLFATGIACLERMTLNRLWEGFIDIFCQWSYLGFFFDLRWTLPAIVIGLLAVIWVITILFYPIRLWWRERTVYHAWLVAMSGGFMPPYIGYYLHHPPLSLFYGWLLMIIGYVIAGLFAYAVRRYRMSLLQSQRENSGADMP